MLRYRQSLAVAAGIALALTLLAQPAASQIDGEQITPGGSCPPGAIAGQANAGDWDTIFECNSSSKWQRGPYFFGATSDTCDSNHAGLTYYNSTSGVLEFCNGSSWNTVGSTTSSCGSPSGLSFTNVSSASLNTVYTSNAATITFSGCSSPYSVSVSGAATAQISVNGGAWATSGAISSGQTLQARLTSSGSVSTGLTATVTVGSSSTNWTVTTRSGSLNAFLTANTYIGGTIGDLSGANAICQAEANTAGYAGTYIAIMSDATTSAASELTLSYPIVNAYDGSTIAATNLWAGTFSNVFKTPSGGGSSDSVWTGTTNTGGIDTGETCSNWSSTSVNGESGFNSATYGAPFAYQALACTSGLHLYCIQQ